MEARRVELSSCQSASKSKKPRANSKSFRFDLALGESNAQICPEFSFSDLVKNVRKNKDSFESDPFGDPDEDAEVAAIAKRFEAKYGSKAYASGKKKRTRDMDDFYDLGDGYDVDDPFIDNTEAYDEVVPSCLSTEHGGFYINKGKLDFKSNFEDSLEEFSSPKMKKKKKKTELDSDSEEETGESLNKKFKAMKRKKLMEKREGEKKKKLSNGKDGSDIVVKKKKKKNLEKLKMKKLSQGQSPAVSSAAASTPSVQAAVTSNPSTVSTSSVTKPVTSTAPTTSLSSAISSSTTASARPSTPISNCIIILDSPDVKSISGDIQAQSKGSELAEESPTSGVLQDINKEDSSSRSGAEDKSEPGQAPKNTQLPSQLPTELMDAIDSIKKEAKDTKEKKSKFFSENVNKLLLDIELGLQSLPHGSRSAIYNHLEEFLPYGKQAIQRRAKKLRENILGDQLKEPLQFLKEAVSKVMPGLQQQHEADVLKAKMEQRDDSTAESMKEEGSTESEGEEKADPKKKTPRGPRRKFTWTPEIRQLLLNVVGIKMSVFAFCRSRNETPEDYLKTFLESEVKPIWPQGWIQTRMLVKESKSAHEEWTKASGPKLKKLVQVKPASPVPESGAQSSTDDSQLRISKTEDVIEISSVLDSSSDFVNDVVVNLPDSDQKPLLSDGPLTTSATIPKSITPVTPTLTQNTKVVNLSSSPSAVRSESSSKGLSESPGARRVNPIPVMLEAQAKSMGLPTAAKGGSQQSSLLKAAWPPSTQGLSSGNPSPSTQAGGRSFSGAFDAFVNATRKPTVTSSPTQQQKVSSFPQQTQPKVSILQQKGTLDQRAANTGPKAASKLSSPMVVNREQQPNASWSSVGSIFPSDKSPVVAMNRIPVTLPSKLSVGELGKLSPYSAQTSPASSVGASPLTSTPKSHFPSKKSVTGEGSHSLLNVVPSSEAKPGTSLLPQGKLALNPQTQGKPPSSSQALGKPAANNQSQSKLTHQNQAKLSLLTQNKQPGSGTSLLNNGNNPLINMQKATVLGTSVQELLHKQQQQMRAGKESVASPSASLSIRTAPGAAPRSGSASSPNLMKQPSPPGRQQAGSQQRNPAQPNPKPAHSPLLSGSPAQPHSRGSTPSPQKSPASPNAAATLFEQIQSQLRSQEAMEGQALKNLAMALKMGHSGSGSDGHP